jgi:hypothetical protein
METDGDDGGKGDLMSVRDLDSYGVEIGRVVQTALGVIVVRTGDWTTRALRRGETRSSSLAELPTH